METREIFEQMASRYDTEERKRIAEIIADALRCELSNAEGKTRGKRALDYGCGTGLVGLKLIDLFESMLFVDTSPKMIAEVQRKIEKGGISAARALCCDFCVEVPPRLSFDFILISQVLLHVKNVPLLIERLFHTLNPRGHLVIIDFDKCGSISSDKVHNGFEQSELKLLLEQIGFHMTSAYTFHHGQKLFMDQDASLFLLLAEKRNFY